jgi:hypothetical protein
MSTAFGLLIFVFYIAVVIAAAAGVTWLVVRFTPTKNQDAASKS